MLGDVFHPQLEGRDYLVADDRIQPLRKVAANVLRRDKIETAGLSPPRRLKLCRIELVVQNYAATFSVEAS